MEGAATLVSAFDTLGGEGSLTSFSGFLSNLDLGEALALLGITITVVQVTRTGRTVRKTREAVESASLRASVYNVLVVAPKMSSLEAQLECAARNSDVESFGALLLSFKEMAAELQGLLHQEKKHSEEAREKLQKSLTLAIAAKLPVSAASTDLYDKTRNVRKAISETCVAVMSLTARLRSDLESPAPLSWRTKAKDLLSAWTRR